MAKLLSCARCNRLMLEDMVRIAGDGHDEIVFQLLYDESDHPQFTLFIARMNRKQRVLQTVRVPLGWAGISDLEDLFKKSAWEREIAGEPCYVA